MKRGFTLIEMLIVIALSLTILSVVGAFFADGWVALQRALARVDETGSLMLLSKSWQRALKDTAPSAWSVEAGAFRSGDVAARQDGTCLVLVRDQKEERIRLPRGATVQFHVESGTQASPCAVMDLQWAARRLARDTTNQVRFVACGRKEGSHE